MRLLFKIFMKLRISNLSELLICRTESNVSAAGTKTKNCIKKFIAFQKLKAIL